MTALVMTNDQTVALHIDPKDRYGQDARLAGRPVWWVNDPSLGTLDIEPTGVTAVFVACGPAGGAVINVTADVFTDGGTVRTVSGVQEILILPSGATGLAIRADKPQPKEGGVSCRQSRI